MCPARFQDWGHQLPSTSCFLERVFFLCLNEKCTFFVACASMLNVPVQKIVWQFLGHTCILLFLVNKIGHRKVLTHESCNSMCHHNHLWRYTLSSKGKSYSSKTDEFLDNFQMANNKEIFQISGKKLAIFWEQKWLPPLKIVPLKLFLKFIWFGGVMADYNKSETWQ